MGTALTVGVILSTGPHTGGGHDYENALKDLLLRHKNAWNLEVKFFVYDKNSGIRKYGPDPSWRITPPARAGSLHYKMFSRSSNRRQNPESLLTAAGVELVYFASPSLMALEIKNIPFISTVWDLGHRDLPEFPEFRGSTWDARENYYQTTLSRSFHVFTDSTVTGESISRLYGVQDDRWTALGLLYPQVHAIAEGNSSQKARWPQYFLYPAKKWPHKNHVVLLRALEEVIRDFPDVKLVFTGSSDGGAFSIIQNTIRELGLERHVVDLGFVDETEYRDLISGATALVMPSYLGPTNIPPLQALQLGTPAIVSDSHFFEPQAQKRMVIVPCESHSSWASAMKRSLLGPRVAPLKFSMTPKRAALEAVFGSFSERKSRWSVD